MARVADPPAALSAPARQPTGLRAVNFRIKPAHVRTLLWLRLRLTLRRFKRSWQATLGLIFGLLFIIPLSAALALLSALGYTQLDRPAAAQLLFGVVALLYLVWAALPLMQYSLNEGLDVTKLQIYPLTRGEEMVSLVLATLLDLSTLVIAALYVAVLVGWHATPLAAVVTAVALAAAYVHTVGLSQLVLAALMGLLRSRRFRDLSIIFFALVGSLCSISGQLSSRIFVPRAGGAAPDPNAALASLHLDQYLRWTPPGMAVQAIVTADSGEYVAALPWLLASLALVPVLLYVWAVVLDRGITNAESGTIRSSRARRRSTAAVAAGAVSASAQARPAGTVAELKRTRRHLISPVALAIAGKDFRYLWRDPQLKAQLISVLFATVFILVPGIYGGGRSGRYTSGLDPHVSVLLAPLPALFVVLTFGLNALGLDRQGLQMLFLFPVRPLDILWGKNVFTATLAAVLAVALTIIKAATTGGWEYAPLALVAAAAGILTMLACGNVTSVIAPFRQRQFRMGETGTYSSENGCLRAVLSTVSLGVTAILLVPVAAAVLAPLIFDQRQWLVASLPLAILYGALLHQLASRLIAPVLQRRVPEILAVTVREA